MASFEERFVSTNKKRKDFAIEIASYATEIIERDKTKIGILLCEGTEGSMDVEIYSRIYSDFVVVPASGCTDIIKLMPFMRKYSEYPVFGIIDRDNCSKKRIRELQETENVYCTKLPFIENILCCPEVLKIITKIYGIDCVYVLREVRSRLMHLLTQKMSLLNPFNIELPPDNDLQGVVITIKAKSSVVYKKIDLANIMYTFRDKEIVSEVADVMGMRSRDQYYKYLRKQLNGENGDKLILAMVRHLPEIRIKAPEYGVP